ncbi:MAG: carboxypeptidase regulatory-like domain-containing protein, partial [Thermodesulfobacteriota bacterium]
TLNSVSEGGRTVNVVTDSSGLAEAPFTLGTRSGAGDQRVKAAASGFSGEIIFSASAVNGPAEGIKTISGENQRGVVGRLLPEPFVVFVHDEDGNPVEEVTVTFEAVEGDGSFDGEPVFFSVTDSRGRAGAVLTLGADEGINNNIVQASFDDMSGPPATFVSSGVIPGRPEDTTVSGVVLDNTDIPLEGVTVTIEGTGLLTTTDDQGQFIIPNAPVGPYLLKADGSTTTRPGTWPELEFEIDIISGVDNTVGTPIFLPPLDTNSAKVAGGSEDVSLTMKDVPGFSITVFANSATFHDGSRTGQVMVSQVHSDKVPMTPIGGAAPLLTWTLQPAGAHFNPPARVTYPNIDNLRPGQVVDIFSFDHGLGEFINVGTGAVSEDGSVITSDPGVGIHSAGWGYLRPPPPPPTCADGCGPCGKCVNNRCVPRKVEIVGITGNNAQGQAEVSVRVTPVVSLSGRLLVNNTIHSQVGSIQAGDFKIPLDQNVLSFTEPNDLSVEVTVDDGGSCTLGFTAAPSIKPVAIDDEILTFQFSAEGFPLLAPLLFLSRLFGESIAFNWSIPSSGFISVVPNQFPIQDASFLTVDVSQIVEVPERGKATISATMTWSPDGPSRNMGPSRFGTIGPLNVRSLAAETGTNWWFVPGQSTGNAVVGIIADPGGGIVVGVPINKD